MSALRSQEADEFMEEGLATLDMEERKEIYKFLSHPINCCHICSIFYFQYRKI